MDPILQWLLGVAGTLAVGLVLETRRALGKKLDTLTEKVNQAAVDTQVAKQRDDDIERRLAKVERIQDETPVRAGANGR